jgi:hypothetical protein
VSGHKAFAVKDQYPIGVAPKTVMTFARGRVWGISGHVERRRMYIGAGALALILIIVLLIWLL